MTGIVWCEVGKEECFAKASIENDPTFRDYKNIG